MSVRHVDLTEANLHENKGVSTATNDFVATATGGATVWKKLTTVNLDSTSFFRTNKFVMNVIHPDVSNNTAVYLVVPVAATLNKVSSVLGGPITVGDATITVKNHAGSSAGTLVIAQSGSAAKDVDTLSPASNNTFTAGQVVTIESDGGSTDTAPAYFTLEFTQTA